MDQLYPLADTTTTSCASQNFDFLNFWVDQTVEKEILRGRKLQALKTRPAKEKYDVINIEHTKRRSRSPRKFRKNVRNHSPIRQSSPVRKFTKRDSKSSRLRCPMRIAELSVPSKRHCIDTWRNKYHVLPGIMIDRLRMHVMDLSPVVKIPDAIECFKMHKNKKQRKIKEARERKMKRDIKKCNCKDKVKKQNTNVQECRYLCAIFGHKIAKELNKPVQITLNTELENIAKVVSIEIEKLTNRGERIRNTNNNNKRVHIEVAGKISIWIANILEETAYKILEDQLQDLEEEVGPVFDLIDDLVDNVVDICEPEPEVIEDSISIDTYSIESYTENKEEESTAGDNISVEIDFPPDDEPIIENLDEFIKNELDNIINLFDRDIAIEIDDQTIRENTEFENIADKQQNEFVDANDTFEVPLNEPEIQANTDNLQDSSQAIEEPLITDQEKDISFSEDDSNKKVKFSDVNMVANDDTTEEGTLTTSDFHLNHVFSAPNDHLLSNSDESWPEDMTPFILRPSASVSKSITSLGKIIESDEKMSIMLDDEANEAKELVKDMTADSKQINETNKEITDANEIIKQLDNNTEVKDTNIDTQAQAIINETGNIISINDNNQSQEVNEIINRNLADTIQLNEQIEVENDGSKVDTILTDQDLGRNEPTYTKDLDIEKDGTQQNDEYLGKDVTTLTKDQEIIIEETERTDDYLDKDGTTFIREQEVDKEVNGKDNDQDGNIYKEEQGVEGQMTTSDDIYRPSMDSIFNHDVPVETVAYEQKLEKILEEQATQVAVTSIINKELRDEATQVKIDKLLEDKATQITPTVTAKKVYVETADKEINTTSSLIQLGDKSTSIASQSLRDITKHLQSQKADKMFSSLRIKPTDYKVYKKSAPAWVTQNYGEPTDSFGTTTPNQQKGANDKNIRLWCKDLDNGFQNLELWNGWIENTIESVKITDMRKARMCTDKSRDEFVRDWLDLKKNVDADVLTWTKLSKSTREKLEGFRKICQNFETLAPPPQPQQNKFCNCHK